MRIPAYAPDTNTKKMTDVILLQGSRAHLPLVRPRLQIRCFAVVHDLRKRLNTPKRGGDRSDKHLALPGINSTFDVHGSVVAQD